MKRVLFALLAAMLLLSACNDDTPQVPAVRRTILVYMAARNSLSGLVDDDLKEMKAARIPDDCRLLVYRSDYSAEPALYEVKADSLRLLLTYKNAASAVEAQTLKKVLADAANLAPAADFGLVFWSHSDGWRQNMTKAAPAGRGFGLDGGQIMPLTDLAATLKAAPMPLSFLFFDSCYMGCVEVAYELRDCASFLAASPAEVPTAGMPYHLTVEHLFDADTSRGLIAAIDLTADYYAPRTGSYCPSTLALTDLSAMEDVAQACRPALGGDVVLPEGFVPQCFSATEPYRSIFFDLRQCVNAFNPAGAEALDAALEKAVVHERHSAKIWGTIPIDHFCGLTIFIPSEDYTYSSYGYNELSWYGRTKN